MAALWSSFEPAGASSRIAPSWQSVVADAGFVGVVECEVAGGIVARYRVIDSWKGPLAGSRLLIGRYTNEWEPQYPLALVGERYFVAADTAHGSRSLPPLPNLGSVPLWWRQIPPEYFEVWGPTRIPPPKPGSSQGILGWARDGQGAQLDSFKVDVLRLLHRDERYLELEVLRAAARYWYRMSKRGDPKQLAEPCTTAACLAVQSDSLETVVSALIDFPASGGLGVLAEGGRWVSLRRLQSLSKNSDQRQQETLDYAKKRIRVRLGIEAPTAGHNRYDGLSYSDSTRVRLLQALNAGSGHGLRQFQFRESFERLTVHDPQVVAQFLMNWEAPSRTRADSGAGYETGSYFAYRCGKDRRRHLTTLLGARDPYVRVAAAVYLCFESEAQGKQALARLTGLPGDAGAWAALTLSRRGDKSAMPRALQVLQEREPFGMAGVPHRNLQKRVMELISNSASMSRIALRNNWNPEYWTEETVAFAIYAEVYGWWQANVDRITLHDPWLEVLAAKKID